MCFDKTGTLTKDGLDFVGVHEAHAAEEKKEEENSAGLSKMQRVGRRGGNTIKAIKKMGLLLTQQAVVSSPERCLRWGAMLWSGAWRRAMPCLNTPTQRVNSSPIYMSTLFTHFQHCMQRDSNTLTTPTSNLKFYHLATATDYVGNQVEVQMFKSTGCSMTESSDGRVKISGDGIDLTIVRKFEFDHAK